MSTDTAKPPQPGAEPPEWVFSHATRLVIFGAGSLSRLKEHTRGARQCLIVLDPFFAGHPLCERLAGLPGAPVFHVIPDGEPTGASVTETAQALTAAEPDVVIALGGGSAIDTAKAALALAANPGPLAPLFWPEARIEHAHPARFIAIPTTAGAGSELSETAVIDMPGTVYKSHMRAPSLGAGVVILDPELTVSAPRGPTVVSGYDALTHAVEAYTSRAANPMTDPLALSAAGLLIDNLARAAEAPDDIAARGACLLGSAQAGIAFNSAHLGLAHAIAGALGALHHVSHGLANALALPWTMAFNRTEIPQKDATLAALFGAPSTAAGLSRLRFDLGLDLSLDDYVSGTAALDAVAEAAMTSGQIAMNPRTPRQSDVRAILEAMRRPTGGGEPELSI